MPGAFFQEVESLVQKILQLPPGKVLAVTHRNADVESVTSAAILSLLIEGMRQDVELDTYFPEGVSAKAFGVVSLLEVDTVFRPQDIEDYLAIVFLDVGGPGALGEAKTLLDTSADRWLIDHHLHGEDFLSAFDLQLVESDEVSSTCEILYYACENRGIKLNENLKKAMLAAIIVESRFLRLVRCRTLELMSRLCREGVGLNEAFSLLAWERDISSKLAVLKGMKRATIMRSGEWVAAFSHVGAFQSEVANALISAGGDIAVVGNDENGGCKVHIRTSDRFVSELSITAGKDIVDFLTSRFGGGGGGHPSAAAAQLDGPMSQVFADLEQYLKDRFSSLTKAKFVRVE